MDNKISYRKKQFKKGIDTDDLRRERADEACQIRKQKREENLSKRRHTHRILREKPEIIVYQEKDKYFCESIKNLHSNDTSLVLKALSYIRKRMSLQNPPTQDLLDSNAISRIVDLVSYTKYPDHQKEAVWILTNAISGPSEQSRYVLDNTLLIDYIGRCFNIPNRTLKEECIWCIANIAGESEKYRDVLIDNGTYDAVLTSFTFELGYEKRSAEFIKNYTWCISNFVKAIPVSSETCFKALPVLNQVIKNVSGDDILNDALWSLNYITSSLRDEELIIFLKYNIFDREIFKFFESDKLTIPLLRTCGNLIAGPNETTQYILDLGFLTYLPDLSKKVSLRKEICWIISNITAGTKVQIQAILHPDLILQVIEYLKNERWEVKRECAYAIYNIIMGNDIKYIDYIISMGCAKPLCDLLSFSDVKIVKLVLKCINNLLELDEKYFNLVEEYALDSIEALQYNSSEEIYEMCINIIEKFFTDETFNMEIDSNTVFNF